VAAVAALVGFGFLLGLAFGVRTVIHRRATGDSGWRVAPTRAAWLGDGLFTMGVVGAVVGAVLDTAGVLEPIDALHRLAVQAVGVVVLASGGALAVLAQIQMGTSWRAGIDTSADYELVRNGLFRVVRNPFYLGIILAAAGVALLAPNIVTFSGWIAVVLGCEIDVRVVEEPLLAATKGQPYCEYAATTGRFLPGVGRTAKAVR
jgi:protein-S-isoprenylcysteine O-methyltransferase Ste14